MATSPVVLPSREETAAKSAARWQKAFDNKDRQIAIVSSQNDQLRSSLAQLESEMNEISKALLAKESVVYGKDRELKKKDDEIKRLLSLEQRDQGKEHAISMATGQNSQLLTLLEIHEDKSTASALEREKAAAELADLRAMHSAHLQSASKMEAELRGNLARLTQTHEKLVKEHAKLEQRHHGFEEMVLRTEREAKATVQSVEEELLIRRDKQFEALVRVQSLEDRLQATQDSSEVHQEQEKKFTERSEEMTSRLKTVIEQLKARDVEIETLQLAQVEADARHATELQAKDHKAQELQQQADEVGRALLQLVAKHKERGATLETRGQQVSALKEELVASRSAEADREAEVAEASLAQSALEQRHDALRVEANRLKRELQTLRAEMDLKAKATIMNPAGVSENDRAVSSSSASLATSRRNAIDAVLRLGRSLAVATPLSPPEESADEASKVHLEEPRVSLPLEAVSSLSLAGCGLDERDLSGVLNQLAQCTQLVNVDLSANHLTDQCVEPLTHLLEQLPDLALLDLRGNYLSMEGVRSLALFVEGSRKLRGGSIRHVYVHRDGQIEAIGNPPPSQGGRPSSSQGPSPTTLLTIDARENHGNGPVAAPSIGTPSTAEKIKKAESLSTYQQRQRKPAKRNNAYSSRGDLLANVYGGEPAPQKSTGKVTKSERSHAT